MSQRLRISTRKDGKAKGVMIRKTNATKNNPKLISALFMDAYNRHLEAKNGKSKNKTSKKNA